AGVPPRLGTEIMMVVRLSTSVRRQNPSAPMTRATKTDSANPIAFTITMARSEENDPPRMKRRTAAGRLMAHGLLSYDGRLYRHRALGIQEWYQTAFPRRLAWPRTDLTWMRVGEWDFS